MKQKYVSLEEHNKDIVRLCNLNQDLINMMKELNDRTQSLNVRIHALEEAKCKSC